MNQPLVSVLSPPLLLAVDGSASAGLAQKLTRPIAELMLTTQDTSSSVLTIATVQPRVPNRARQLARKAKVEAATEVAVRSEETVTVSSQDSTILSIERLTSLVREDFAADFPLSLEVRQGRPATEILNCARTIGAQLIVVGHRGVGGVRELLLGSVSTAIARYAACSVLVARAQTDRAEPSLRHVLLAVDDSPATQRALEMVRQLAPAGIEQVTLLHVQSPVNANYLMGPFVSPNPSWLLSQSLQDAQREQGERVLQQAQATLDSLAVQTRLRTGDPGPVICKIAQEMQTDLIVLGSEATRRSLLSPLQALRSPRRGNQTTPRPVLRNTRLSVTEDYVIHYAPCSVLLCRAP